MAAQAGSGGYRPLSASGLPHNTIRGSAKLLIISGLILFWLNLFCCAFVAFAYGRVFERLMAVGLFLISIASFVIGLVLVLPKSEWVFLSSLTDWIILLVAWYYALTSNRYWPIWFAAMQTLTVLTLAIAYTQSGMPHLVLLNLAAFWALPALMVMSWGTILDWRERAPASPYNS